jgi:hypothetical protein
MNTRLTKAARVLGRETSVRKRESSRKNIQLARRRLQEIIEAGKQVLTAKEDGARG